MSLKVIIPTPLRKFTGNADTIEVETGTVLEILERLEEKFPGFRSRVCDESGQLRRFINVYIDGEDVRFLNNLSTSVPDKAELSIVPAIAGG